MYKSAIITLFYFFNTFLLYGQIDPCMEIELKNSEIIFYTKNSKIDSIKFDLFFTGKERPFYLLFKHNYGFAFLAGAKSLEHIENSVGKSRFSGLFDNCLIDTWVVFE